MVSVLGIRLNCVYDGLFCLFLIDLYNLSSWKHFLLEIFLMESLKIPSETDSVEFIKIFRNWFQASIVKETIKCNSFKVGIRGKKRLQNILPEAFAVKDMKSFHVMRKVIYLVIYYFCSMNILDNYLILI